MPIKYTDRGYIDPPERQELSLEEFREHFVEAFPKSETREKLYNGYLRYTKDFREEITTAIIQWIGGSFSSNKLNPRDIDVVTIIPSETFEEKSELIERKFRKSAKSVYGVDAYIVSSYPEEHEKYPLYHGNLVYWDNQFTQTRKNRAGKRFRRGYVQIIHQRIAL
ncbi:hypothetical protein [Lewinella sp. LCG006]|uniref:DUF6932 family protein n=1 Tax=Lewinella sp. LCG006 TaxID=3231911 RepID=UPI0034616B39